ncbi:protein C1orf43 homolog [Paramacrobiotus metropolitanus]|uniref:protein C1orf43 homolog n=1 Tax=Paramacrobiotus metropolitanus TaxID=2943436 RepID=UPI0024457ACF|nr:protein C1orf43 homolog [Paramacrobiotus metropolitanus]
MAKLSGVEIIIIIGVGFAVFVILFIVAHRQIARFKVRDLLSKPLLKCSQFGASPSYVAQIQRKVAEVLDIDVQPQMWDDHWVRFFNNQTVPNYVYRAKALDFCVLLKIELLKFGPQFSWTAFEDLGEYFDRLKTEYPIDRIPVEVTMEFVQLYRRCRWDDAEFGEREYIRMHKYVTDILELLENLRLTAAPSDRSLNISRRSSDSERIESKESRMKDKSAGKKFPKGYEPLDSDGSTAGSLLTKRGAKPFSKFKKAATGNRKGKAVKLEENAWEEQIPLHTFHDNPLT